MAGSHSRAPRPDWAALGLRGNPFQNVEPGTRLEWVDWPHALRAALASPPCCVEILGRRRGEGKSTLLRAVEASLRQEGRAVEYRYLSPHDRFDGQVPSGTEVFLLDEADRASRRAIGRVSRWREETRGSLVLGTHAPLAIPGALQIDLSAHRLRGWIAARVRAHALPGTDVPDFERWLPDAERAAGGVNYGILRVLYELAEELARGRANDEVTFTEAVRRARADLLSP